jgi:hypothetical protein
MQGYATTMNQMSYIKKIYQFLFQFVIYILFKIDMEHQLLFRTTAKHVNIFIKIMLRDLPIVYSGLLD